VGKIITRSVHDVRRRRRWVRRILVGAVALALLAALVWAFMPRPIPAGIAPVTRAPLRVTVDEDGRAQVLDRYVVAAPVTGTLGRVALRAGDAVEAGAVVARVWPSPAPLLDGRARATAEQRLAAALAAERQARAQLERGTAAASYARTEQERAEGMHARGAVPDSDLERAKFEAAAAAADERAQRLAATIAALEVESARIALRAGAGGDAPVDVIAPAGGRVLRVTRDSAGPVAAGTPLVEIGDPAALEVIADVLSADAVRIVPGAVVTLDGWGGPPLVARVRRVEPSAFTRVSALGVDEQRVDVHIDLVAPRAQWSALADGYRVAAHIVVWERADALQAPASAVFRHDGGWAAYRVTEGVARLAPVTLGERGAAAVEIARGLAVGDRVIVYPGDKIADGVRVAAHAP
jgi:HlyD family secretion protein